MEHLTAILIDDENESRKLLRLLLEKHFPDIEVIVEADTIESGISAINSNKFDVLFLDIELKKGTGFDILRQITNRQFDLIFVTAFGHYALKAFKFSAIDYLMKPVDIEELINAINRIKNSKSSNNHITHDYNVLFENLEQSAPTKFAIPSSEGLEYIKIDDVLYIKADGSYVEIVLSDRSRKTVAKNLKDFQEKLYDRGFFRTHKSYLVNLKHIKKYLKKDGGYLEMVDGSIVMISRNSLEPFKEAMNKYLASC